MKLNLINYFKWIKGVEEREEILLLSHVFLAFIFAPTYFKWLL